MPYMHMLLSFALLHSVCLDILTPRRHYICLQPLHMPYIHMLLSFALLHSVCLDILAPRGHYIYFRYGDMASGMISIFHNFCKEH